MSWLNVLIPFATSFAQSFLKEYNTPLDAAGGRTIAPPRGGGSGFTIVDSGSGSGFQWVAVPKREGRAFKAAHPDFAIILNFLKAAQRTQKKFPADFRAIQPFVLEVCEAVERYDDDCAMFIRRTGR